MKKNFISNHTFHAHWTYKLLAHPLWSQLDITRGHISREQTEDPGHCGQLDSQEAPWTPHPSTSRATPWAVHCVPWSHGKPTSSTSPSSTVGSRTGRNWLQGAGMKVAEPSSCPAASLISPDEESNSYPQHWTTREVLSLWTSHISQFALKVFIAVAY